MYLSLQSAPAASLSLSGRRVCKRSGRKGPSWPHRGVHLSRMPRNMPAWQSSSMGSWSSSTFVFLGPPPPWKEGWGGREDTVARCPCEGRGLASQRAFRLDSVSSEKQRWCHPSHGDRRWPPASGSRTPLVKLQSAHPQGAEATLD